MSATVNCRNGSKRRRLCSPPHPRAGHLHGLTERLLFGEAVDGRGRSCPLRLILPVEGALPILSEGPEPHVLPGLVVQLVPIVAPASLGGSDMEPAGGPVDGAGVSRGLDEGLVAWKPAEIGGRRDGSEVYRVEGIELSVGDRIRWTRNNAGFGLVDSRTAEVL